MDTGHRSVEKPKLASIAVLLMAAAALNGGCRTEETFPYPEEDTANTTTVPTDTGDTGTRPECSDGEDNDGDGLTDAIDPECFENGLPDGNLDQEASQCGDGMDNNQNGYIDNADPGCWEDPLDPNSYQATDTDETTTGFQAPSYPEGYGETDTGDTALLLTNTRQAVDATWKKVVDLRVS